MNKLYKNFLNKLDYDQLCIFCVHRWFCNKETISDGCGNPIYPLCEDGDYNYIDLDEVKEIMKKNIRRYYYV